MANNTQQTVGAVPQNAKRTKVDVTDPYKDTPYFGPGLEKDSEHMKAFPKGMEIAGVLRAIRTTQAKVEKDQKDYLCLEDLNTGAKFRIGAPGQLYFLAEKVGLGARIVIRYMGKEWVEAHNKELHQFQVDLIEGSVN